MELARVTLDDKYTLQSGRIYLSGIQALVRLPMMQRRADRAAGLNTAGFISGYRGSPLGGYDNALWQARPLLDAHDICFQPGLMRTLPQRLCGAASRLACFGRQSRGRIGIWFGKGPVSTVRLTHCATPIGLAPLRMVVCWPSPATTTGTVFDHRAPERAGVRSRDDADPLPGERTGISRSRPLWLCAVTVLRMLGRLQDDQ